MTTEDLDRQPQQRLPRPARVRVPPTRFANPVEVLDYPLEPMTPVTMGGSGWWLIDQMLVTDGPYERSGQEVYEVRPLPEWGASVARGAADGASLPGAGSVMVPTSKLWIYYDEAEESRYVDELHPPSPLAWQSRVQPAYTTEPPQVRVPRPARELPSMTGATVRYEVPGGWEWAKALSEPLNDIGEYTVAVCAMSDYWRAVYQRPNKNPTWLRRVALTRVWTY